MSSLNAEDQIASCSLVGKFECPIDTSSPILSFDCCTSLWLHSTASQCLSCYSKESSDSLLVLKASREIDKTFETCFIFRLQICSVKLPSL